MSALASRLPDTAWFHRHRGKFAGFAFGVAAPLLLAGVVWASFTGGLSLHPVNQPSIYFDF
jgi:hypothetical protein